MKILLPHIPRLFFFSQNLTSLSSHFAGVRFLLKGECEVCSMWECEVRKSVL